MNPETKTARPAPTLSLWQTLHELGAFRRWILARLLTLQRGQAQVISPLRTQPHPPAPSGLVVTQRAARHPGESMHQPENSYQAFTSSSHHRTPEQTEVERHNFAARFRDR